MTIIVAVTDDPEGRLALSEGVAEARLHGIDLVAVNLGVRDLDVTGLDTDGIRVIVTDRKGPTKGKDDPREIERDPVDAVLDEIDSRSATRLVIGVKRRTPVGKAILGSLSQHLLLNSPVPVLAVKVPANERQARALDDLPDGIRRVTG